MKKRLLSITLVLLFLCGCQPTKQIKTPEEVQSILEDANYEIGIFQEIFVNITNTEDKENEWILCMFSYIPEEQDKVASILYTNHSKQIANEYVYHLNDPDEINESTSKEFQKLLKELNITEEEFMNFATDYFNSQAKK